jgi:hypothetical protein
MEGAQQPREDSVPWFPRFALYCVMVGGIGVVVVALMLPAINTGDRNPLGTLCANHLRRVGLALQNYHSTHGSFPPAYFADTEGRPMHSWRVIILPYMEDQQAQQLAKMYRWEEPWDSEHNLALTERYMPVCYACPKDESRAATQTNYLAITGPGTAWNGAHVIREKDATDGLSHTVFITEATGLAVYWSEPRDLSVNQMIHMMRPGQESDSQTPRLSHKGGANFLFLEASVHFIQRGVPSETLRALSTIAGGEEFEPPF